MSVDMGRCCGSSSSSSSSSSFSRNFLSLLVVGVVLLHVVEASSPWNQAGLNLIFKPDLLNKQRLKGGEKSETETAASLSSSGSTNSGPSSSHSISGKSGNNGSPTTRNQVQKVKNLPSHSWGYTKYGQEIGHIRHIASRKKHLTNNYSVPCPRDYVKLFNGKCRRMPRFSPSRVG